MADSETRVATVITPAVSADVAFTEKINDVDTALKARSTAQKDIKVKWAAIVKLLIKHNLHVPVRRVDVSTAASYANNIAVYTPQDPKLAENKELVEVANDAAYTLKQLMQKRTFEKLVEEKFAGFKAFADELIDLDRLSNQRREIDEDATKAAKEEMQEAVDAYIASIEAYDETIEKVADVKEYIGVVKDVAEISAIAAGRKDQN